MYHISPPLSGERFEVLYRLQGSREEAEVLAMDTCIEQTVEFPKALLPKGDIPEQILGRIIDMQPCGDKQYEARISYPVEAAGGDLVQLMNVIFGNTSIKSGVRVEELFLSEGILGLFRGPRFGRQGLRELLDAPTRPLLCTAIKPMGLSPEKLAEQAYAFALGGIDIIKDDHGLADQPFSPFYERVQRCAEAVHLANAKTGFKSIYMPSMGAPAHQILEKARFAKQNGAGGLLVPPGLVGFDSMRMLADDDSIALPIMSHPAFIGSYVSSPTNGFSHFALFGQLARLAGADTTVYANWGGRFSYTKEECISIINGSQVNMGHIAPIFPTPGGGMTLDRLPEMAEVYGREVIFLMGGGLHGIRPTLVESSSYIRNLVEKM
jgi:ribulose-bisphosphate carboxylase large chain